MKLTCLLLGTLAAALMAGSALAQAAPGVMSVKDGGNNPKNVAGYFDASGNYHFGDVMEGRDGSGNPLSLRMDADLGVWMHVVNWPTSQRVFAQAGDFPIGTFGDWGSGSQIDNDLKAPIPLGSNYIGQVGLDQTGGHNAVVINPINNSAWHLSGGTTASTNAILAYTGAHRIVSLSAINIQSTIGFLKLYDTATTPNCASATGLLHVWPVPQNNAQGSGWMLQLPRDGIPVVNGVGFCFTGGGGDTDNTAGPAGTWINEDHQ